MGVGVDMALAIDKAEVFVGNGVSSFPLSFLIGEWSFYFYFYLFTVF